MPREAALVLHIDVAGLRRAPVLSSLIKGKATEDYPANLGFDPTRDLSRVVLAASGASGQGGQLNFLLAMRGSLKQETVLGAMKRRGYRLTETRRRGHTLYQDAVAQGPHLLFGGSGVMIAVSPGSWTELLLDRLQAKGSSVLAKTSPMAADIHRVAEKHATWVISRLSTKLGKTLAGRLGVEELAELTTVRGAVDSGEQLRMSLDLDFSSAAAAKGLSGRLARLRGSLAHASGLRVQQRDRTLKILVSMSAEQVSQALKRLEGMAIR